MQIELQQFILYVKLEAWSTKFSPLALIIKWLFSSHPYIFIIKEYFLLKKNQPTKLFFVVWEENEIDFWQLDVKYVLK